MTAKMTSAFNRYFSALNNLDQDAYVACFSSNAELSDPYGGRIFAGPGGLKKWFLGMERTWAEFNIRPETSYESGDRVAVQWTATATSNTGKTAQFSGINIFTIGEAGLILRLEGYWDVSAMMAQIV
jgi:ketosteroid isomerase-like protein